MPTFKMTTLFQYASNTTLPGAPIHRTGGWTESWYWTGNTLIDLINFFRGVNLAAPLTGYWNARAVLLPGGSSIVGFRAQSVLPPGPIQTGALSLSGPVGQTADIPQMALLVRTPAVGANNIRRWFIRGVPDANVVDGEYQSIGSFGAGTAILFQNLAGMQFRARDLSQPVFPIVTITLAGLVTLQTPYTGQVNDMVRILRSLDSGRNLHGGRFQVTAIGPGNTVQISNWPFAQTTGGSMRKDAVIYPSVDPVNTAISRIVTKRVGRPFVGYRGRRSKKRQ